MPDKVYLSIINSEPITKGWSEDKKYCVTTTNLSKYLLRISPIARYEARKSLFDMLEKVADLNIPICKPVEFGTCDDTVLFQGGVYSIQSWIDGDDLEAVLPSLTEAEQYMLGVKSGEILREIHSIPAPETQEEWEPRFNRKADIKIKKYHECGLSFNGDELVLDYIDKNRHLLKNRPQCFQHGDYHVGNMMVENGELTIIDFDRYDYGDPWEEFNRIVWSAQASPHFATGQLRGYFGGEPPLEFFKLLAFYIASNTLSSIYWSISFGPSSIDTMMKQAQDVLHWFDNMKNPVPTWYLNNYELWDIYDKDRKKTGHLHERGIPMEIGDYHIIVHVWKRNSKGEWLIDKRTPRYGNNDLDGKWETTGGCAIAGDDSLTAALRETKEELGIELNPDKGTLFSSINHKWDDGHTAFVDVWVFEYNEPIENVAFDGREVCDAMWANVDKIKGMMLTGDFLEYFYFSEMIMKFGV